MKNMQKHVIVSEHYFTLPGTIFDEMFFKPSSIVFVKLTIRLLPNAPVDCQGHPDELASPEELRRRQSN